MPGSGELVVLGIDPGSRVTGYGVVAERSGQLRLVAAGTVCPNPKAEFCCRLADIFRGVAGVIREHGPLEAAVENVFVSKNVLSALKLGQARGAAIAACASASIAVSSYEPTLVKKSLVGVGRAEKSQVAFMVGRLLGVKPDWKEDASDALAVAICHLNERRMRRLAGIR